MVIRQKDKYTVSSVAAELKQLLKEDIPQEFKDWARDGISFAERNPDADVMDFPNNIFGYIRKTALPPAVRELVEGIYLQEIEKGSGMAACNLGALYYTGQIGEQSYQKAYECFSKGAFQGKVTSLYKIGDMYKNGYYVSQDFTEAFRIYSHCLNIVNNDQDAEKADGADIYVRLADCLLNAVGCEKDALKALFWATRAECEFRVREADGRPFARHGIDWAVDLVNACRNDLDGYNNKYHPS